MFAMPRLTPFVKWLMVALTVVFVTTAIADNWVIPYPGVSLFGWLALNPGELGPLTVVQILTYPFMHPAVPGGVTALLFSLLGAWWMLSPTDERWGTALLLRLMIVSQLLGAAAALAVGFAFPSLVGSPVWSAGFWTMAALTHLATIHGRATITFLIVPMPAWVAFAIALGWSVLSFLTTRDVPNLAADLGSIAGGWAVAKWQMRPRTPPKPRKKRAGDGRPGFTIIKGGRDDDEDDDDSGPRDRPRWLN